MSPPIDILDRFHRALLQEIAESRPEYLTGPFTVAEIYQNLVPYRSHRDLIGVEMNGDYEDALLRLLAGEGDYLVLESEVARREIRAELSGPNPNTGLFRDFAAADVRLNPDRVREAAVGGGPTLHRAPVGSSAAAESDEPIGRKESDPSGATGGVPHHGEGSPEGTEDGVIGHIERAEHDRVQPDLEGPLAHDGSARAESGHASNPTPTGSTDRTGPAESIVPESDLTGGGGEESSASDLSACQWCRQSLPNRNVLNFCPFCGSNLTLSPCSKCGEELEPGWQFCVSCGTPVHE